MMTRELLGRFLDLFNKNTISQFKIFTISYYISVFTIQRSKYKNLYFEKTCKLS